MPDAPDQHDFIHTRAAASCAPAAGKRRQNYASTQRLVSDDGNVRAHYCE
jgi:hypothetical protein